MSLQMFLFLLVFCLLLALVILWRLGWLDLQPSHSRGGANCTGLPRLLKPRNPDDCPCAGYLECPFENEQGKSCLPPLARDEGMEEKIVSLPSSMSFSGTDIPSSQHSWLFSMLLALLSGYGYRIWRILAAYAIVVSLFALAYFVLGLHYPPHLPLAQAFLESITAFHGRVFLDQFSPTTPQMWFTALEAIAGLVIEGIFIAMLIQRFFAK